MHPHKKMGGTKESQDQHETERRESLPAQAKTASPDFCPLPR